MNVRTEAVRRDGLDLRDQIYSPSLRPLLPRLQLSEVVLAALRQDVPLYWLPRSQGDEGSCGGQAVAAVVDLQRMLQSKSPEDLQPSSARMLTEMAQQQVSDPARGVSLRDVIKGFYHNGVCSDGIWPYEARDPKGGLDVQRAKDARSTCLGAYFRLRPSLNDYHSAIGDVGPIVVSASIHPNWETTAVRRSKGCIVPSDEQTGQHAFVIVGYDDTGFLVLNSWGSEWGGFDRCQGVAHWSYGDWADNIMDGWVIRLGVPTPSVFPLSVGDQGIYFSQLNPPVRSTPGYDVLGHLVHIDDGEFVSTGPYPSSRQSLEETVRYLRRETTDVRPVAPGWTGRKDLPDPGYRGILLSLCGSAGGIGSIAAQVAKGKRVAKEVGLYPLAVAWCNDASEQTQVVLEQVFTEAEKQVRIRGNELDQLIETRTHALGRAFWRDIERGATQASSATGPLIPLFQDLAGLREYSLHIICDGAGAILLREIMRSLKSTDADYYLRLLELTKSVDFITPVIDCLEFRIVFADLLRLAGDGRCAVTTHAPSKTTESRLRVGAYSKSLLHLIENSFSSLHEMKPNFLGKSEASILARNPEALKDFGSEITRKIIRIETGPEFLRHEDLHRKSNLMASIITSLAQSLKKGGIRHGREQDQP